MSRYLFLFTIGPVQSFISQSRKTQDLFGGSQILSSLIKDILFELNNKNVKCIRYPLDIVFPNKPKDKDLNFYPNKFTMIVDTNNIQQVGNSLKEYAENKFREYSEKTLDINFKELNIENIKKDFLNQINDFLEVYWVAIPLDEKKYYETYKLLESHMGAVKNIRAFSQLEERGRKCSICGCRNALFTSVKSNRKDGLKNNKGFNKQNVVYLDNNKLKKQEGLCAVCFTKRFFKVNSDNKEFDSLARISILDSLKKIIKDDEGKKLLGEYKKCFSKNDFNEELLFKENVVKEYFEKCLFDYSEKTNYEYSQLYSYMKRKNIYLNKYFAALAFDGDSMGKWLSGEKIKEPENNLNKFHKDLSRRLMKFAKEAKEYVDKECGRTVYAGGEDFLGLINLEKLFDAMKYLRNQFNENVSKPLKSYYLKEKYNITFSAGIVITHYKVPFSETLKWTRNMEKKAKNDFDNKDSFSIALLRRSGEISQAVFRWKKSDEWDENCETQWNTENLKNIIESIKEDNFSCTFLARLMREFRMFDYDDKSYDDMLKCEIARLVKQSCKLEKKPSESDIIFIQRKNEQINKIIINMIDLYENASIEGSNKIQNFLSALSIINFISRSGSYEN